MRRLMTLATTFAIFSSVFASTTSYANGCSLAQTGTEVTGIGTCSDVITIPNGITSIGANAFQSSTITSVTIPNSVTSIGNYAFYDSRELVTVTIGNGVTSIGESAFETNIALTSITFAADSALTSIGNAAFYNASSLASITIPSGVTSIGDYSFYITGALSTVRLLGNTAPTVGISAFYWYSARTTRAIVNSDVAKSTFTPLVSGEWNSLRVVTLAEADAEDSATVAEQSASAARETARAAAAQIEVDKRLARDVISSDFKSYTDTKLEIFKQAQIIGFTAENIEAAQVEITALPAHSSGDISGILKIARKYEVVGIIASERVTTVYSNSLIEIGLIHEESKHKAALMAAIKKLPVDDRSSYAEIKEAIDNEMAEIQSRKDRYAAILARITSRNN